ncbi:hypothetical protein [Corynebacterium glyciniphilum]|uniref:hypothetical protein n=1 Tax=Corynebacterium glyciniphilum TaxID=1404244 RepID=UPI00264B3C5F|nr:hypothetical protein [Corynebacterium glyciniphilum]MDN6706704.1 hypothetical protein [Corynebacterium glyciniphilum]
MAFRIENIDRPENYVDFEIEQADGKVANFSIPKSDCIAPSVLKKLDSLISAQGENSSIVELNRESLKILAPEHKKVFDTLVQRQMDAIFKHWNDESEVPLGESEASTDS